MSSGSIINFERPPVVETVLGVQFSPIAGWGLPHFGLFWNRIRSEFPKFEVQPPLASQIETFELIPPQVLASIEFASGNEARCWYIGADSQHLVQVQHDRFLSNWRQGQSTRPYPRYDDFVKPKFVTEWERFVGFLKDEELSTPDVVQCEVTYVNHIPQGEGWESITDWDQVFTSCGSTRHLNFLPSAEAVRFSTRYRIPDDRGRVHVEAHHAIRISDQKYIIVFTLTARGKPKSTSLEDILSWFDLGREWIVRGFTDLTSEKMHKQWKRLSN